MKGRTGRRAPAGRGKGAEPLTSLAKIPFLSSTRLRRRVAPATGIRNAEPMPTPPRSDPPVRAPVLRRIAAALSAMACLAGPAAAQSQRALECRELQTQIAVYPTSEAENRARAALAQRQDEYDRLRAESQALGCGRQQFLFFNQPPAACDGLQQRLAEARARLAQADAAAQKASGPRAQLVAQFEAMCRQPQQPAPRPAGFLEQLFGGRGYSQQPLQSPLDEPLPSEEGPQRGSKAVCVRTCDGGFFPVSYSAGTNSPGQLADLCRAQCPNAETRVYTYNPARDIIDAVSIDGEPYSAHPNALRYRRVYDKACTCRPPDMSWAEALAGAEKMLARDRRDVIVTPEKAEELSRPRNLRAGEPQQNRSAQPQQPRAAGQQPQTQQPRAAGGQTQQQPQSQAAPAQAQRPQQPARREADAANAPITPPSNMIRPRVD
jgi:hypothetical protein